MSESLADRFWKYVNKTDTCWLWTGFVAPQGYGKFKVTLAPGKYKSVPAHRVAFELTYGEILPELFVCHHCDIRNCVRPDHLFVGTHKDNMQDAQAKGRKYIQQDYCKQGHPLTGHNLYLNTRPDGTVKHHCRICRNLSKKKYWQTDKGKQVQRKIDARRRPARAEKTRQKASQRQANPLPRV